MGAESKARQAQVVLVVSGGIAAYKACEVVRRFRDADADVHVAMTRAATKYGFSNPGLPYVNSSPSMVLTKPPAKRMIAWPAAVSHSIVRPIRG